MHQWNDGELAIHRQLKLSEINGPTSNQNVLSSMPTQHQLFFSELPYFVTGSLDNLGRPWASLICGKPGFVQAVSPNHLALCSTIQQADPVFENLSGGGPVAGLGIRFDNRRRNKVSGNVLPNMVKTVATERELQIIITTTQSLGNCPKYINVRKLEYFDRSNTKFSPQAGSKVLDQSCLALIADADTAFLASRGIDDLDVNHRGGPPGFVRIQHTEQGDILVMPDYSGNRLFQSLGNIELTHVAGITFCEFDSGDQLFITGKATNVLDTEEAALILPGAQRLTKITVESWKYQSNSLMLKPSRTSEVARSPYTPSLYTLSTESGNSRHKALTQRSTNNAKMISKSSVTPTVSRFLFQLEKPITAPNAGQHIILDFSNEVGNGYEHMNDRSPQSLNDDLVRSWTITSVSQGESQKVSEVEVMVRKAGIVSSFIHALNPEKHQHHQIVVPLRGIGGDFHLQHNKVLLIIGGIGITPFIRLIRESIEADIAVLYSSKADDQNLIEQLDRGKLTYIRQFCNGVRLSKPDFDAVPDLHERQLYFCGPPGLLSALKEWTTQEIYSENFSY